MRERPHQQLGAREAMTHCGFQFGKNGFHMRLDPMRLSAVPGPPVEPELPAQKKLPISLLDFPRSSGGGLRGITWDFHFHLAMKLQVFQVAA